MVYLSLSVFVHLPCTIFLNATDFTPTNWCVLCGILKNCTKGPRVRLCMFTYQHCRHSPDLCITVCINPFEPGVTCTRNRNNHIWSQDFAFTPNITIDSRYLSCQRCEPTLVCTYLIFFCWRGRVCRPLLSRFIWSGFGLLLKPIMMRDSHLHWSNQSDNVLI